MREDLHNKTHKTHIMLCACGDKYKNEGDNKRLGACNKCISEVPGIWRMRKCALFVCGKMFKPKKDTQTTCSTKCAHKMTRIRINYAKNKSKNSFFMNSNFERTLHRKGLDI